VEVIFNLVMCHQAVSIESLLVGVGEVSVEFGNFLYSLLEDLLPSRDGRVCEAEHFLD
jgi:hypothetical protein